MVISRFAPSPTGDLHIGSVRTALYAWLFAKQQHGKFVLRIEDTDLLRSTEASTDVILEGMEWLGLRHDIGPIYQSHRFERYRKIANDLMETGNAYKCFCTKERLEQIREEQINKQQKPKYDGYCRLHATESTSEKESRPYVIRFATPALGEVHYIDRIRGELKVSNHELDDLVLIRPDGTPTYNFAVVVDDIDMGITMVIRGDDHINNTFRQINLFIAMGVKPPQFAHVSAILGPDGKKLSKRHGATSVLAYKEHGILPEALLNALVRLGWSHGDQEIFSIDEMINLFRIDDVHKSPASFDPKKLIWFNQHYLKTLTNECLLSHTECFLDDLKIDYKNSSKPSILNVIELLKPRVKTLLELAEKAADFYKDNIIYDADAENKFFNKATADLLEKLIITLKDVPDDRWESNELHDLLHKLMQDLNLKLPDLAQPIRIALLGHTNSPSINEVMALLSKNIVLDRLNKAVAYIRSK